MVVVDVPVLFMFIEFTWAVRFSTLIESSWYPRLKLPMVNGVFTLLLDVINWLTPLS